MSARHRSARRASTPLTEFASTASAQIGVVGRRSAVVAASSGLVVSMVGGAPASADTGDTLASGVDTAAVTAAAHAVLATAPVVASPAEAAFTTDVTPVAAVKPAPVVVKRTTSTSRSSSRTSTTTATVANNPAPASVSGNAVLEIAAQYVGVPYVYGGSTPSGFDCSGFLSYVYAQLGVSLPRSSSAYPSIGTRVSAADAQPGDIIWSPGHVAIYAGDGMQIDSPRPGKTIQFRAIWQSNPVFIRVS